MSKQKQISGHMNQSIDAKEKAMTHIPKPSINQAKVEALFSATEHIF